MVPSGFATFWCPLRDSVLGWVVQVQPEGGTEAPSTSSIHSPQTFQCYQSSSPQPLLPDLLLLPI